MKKGGSDPPLGTKPRPNEVRLRRRRVLFLGIQERHAIQKGVVLSKNSVRMDPQRDLLTFQKHVAVMGHAWKVSCSTCLREAGEGALKSTNNFTDFGSTRHTQSPAVKISERIFFSESGSEYHSCQALPLQFKRS